MCRLNVFTSQKSLLQYGHTPHNTIPDAIQMASQKPPSVAPPIAPTTPQQSNTVIPTHQPTQPQTPPPKKPIMFVMLKAVHM